MSKTLSLRRYVKRRNGLPLGAAGSLQAMLKRSLGAASFRPFWQHWNPIWGYYLSRYIMRPLSAHLPLPLAIVLTFGVSGAAHDLAVSLLRLETVFVFTPWFALMGLGVVATDSLGITWRKFPTALRYGSNGGLIVGSFYLTRSLL